MGGLVDPMDLRVIESLNVLGVRGGSAVSHKLVVLVWFGAAPSMLYFLSK
jgi:hypothetical protein